MNHDDWTTVNRELVAKMLSELEYEGVLTAEPLGTTQFRIGLPEGEWHFHAERGIWGWLWIAPGTIHREAGPVLAEALLKQLQPVLGMDDALLAEHLEGLYATLRADMQLRDARRGMTAEQLMDLPPDRLQCLLTGHPKFLLNKERRGWGLDALQRYSPEHCGTFQLHWLAVRRSRMVWRSDPALDISTLLHSALDNDEFGRFQQRWRERGLDDSWLPLPVHPWQWQSKIALDYLPDLASGDIVSLGEFGDHWLAQQSVRTLTNASRPTGLDLKLPLTILNTTCYRGIPGRYIATGPLTSRWLQRIVTEDSTLRGSGTAVLGEPAAGHVAHTGYAALPEASYRYQEMLGAIWRESPSRHLAPGEQAVLMATLMESDDQNRPLIGAYIDRSGLPAEAWLARLFRVVVVPLYHLLCRYGVSLIAHGQNLTLVLKDGVPQRVLLKDLQGDLRLVSDDFPELASLPEDVRAVTVRLSADLLVHDLQTGHFVTVLRFVSRLMTRRGVSERCFYQLLATVLQDYMRAHPTLNARFALFDLFKPCIFRIVVNAVKLTLSAEHGPSRVPPKYVDDLQNPLWLASKGS